MKVLRKGRFVLAITWHRACSIDRALVQNKATLVCVVGPQRRWTAKLSNLLAAVQALDGEVLAIVVTGWDSESHESRTWAESAEAAPLVKMITSELGPWLAKLVVRRDITVSELQNEILNEELLEAYKSIGGLFMTPFIPHHLEPANARSNGNNRAFLLYDLRSCYTSLQAYEVERGRGTYKYFAYNRPDMYWMAPPPPLSLLQEVAPAAVWVPDTMDWDGLNDRFALLPRHVAHVYLNRWDAIRNGSLLEPLRKRLVDPGLHYQLGPEWLTLAVLAVNKVPIARFTSVAAVVDSGQIEHLQSSLGAFGKAGMHSKHNVEGMEAVRALELSTRTRYPNSRPWVWRRARTPRLDPECFFDEKTARLNCAGSGAAKRRFDYPWDDLYTFTRCCPEAQTGISLEGVFLAPSKHDAQRLITEGTKELCWRVSAEISRCVDLLPLAK